MYRKEKKNRLVILVCAVCLLLGFSVVQAEQHTDSKRLWNLQEADIKTVIDQVSRETGKNFVLDSRVSGKITVVSHQAIDAEEVYQVFLSILQVMGFAAIESNGVTKIVPDASARHMGLPVGEGQYSSKFPDMVVEVIAVKNVSAQAIVPVLRPLISPQGGHLSAYGPSNRLIVADRAPTVSRVAEIIRRIDVDDSSEMEIVSVEHAIPSEVVNVLNTIVNARKPGEIASNHVTLSADDRSNTIIMSGDKQRRLKLRAVIASMDIEAPGTGNTEVIYIKYQKAEDLVKVIINVIESYFGANKANQKQARASGSATLDSLRNIGSSNTKSNSSSSIGKVSDVGQGLQTESRESVGTVIGGFGVQAEPNLNALVVTAPSALMRNIKSIINQLDIRRPQVLVEAILVELEDRTSSSLGIDWRLGGAGFGGFTSSIEPGSLAAIANQLADSSAATLTPATGLSVGIIRNGSLRTLLTALQADTGNNILATPSIVALDNSKAKIFVGEKVPFKTGDTTTTGGNTSNQISREDVGLGLAIVPQITMDESIVLSIEQQADTVVPATSEAERLTQTTTNRLINTKVVVNNGDILVLGGLIRSQEEKSTIKIPLLGDLPIVGPIFRSQSKAMVKRNLMVFLRPTIMRDNQSSLIVTRGKYNYMRDNILLNHLGQKQKKQLPDKNMWLPALDDNNLVNLPRPFAEH